jgi:hypothetical protein
MKESRFSRAELAEQLSEAAGRTISESHLDAYAAETKAGYRLPAELVGAWVQVTGSRRVLEIICGAAGLCAMDETERRLAALGRAQIRREKLDADMAGLKSELWAQV